MSNLQEIVDRLETCSTIEEAYNIFKEIEPYKRSKIAIALPAYIKDKLVRLSVSKYPNG